MIPVLKCSMKYLWLIRLKKLKRGIMVKKIKVNPYMYELLLDTENILSYASKNAVEQFPLKKNIFNINILFEKLK